MLEGLKCSGRLGLALAASLLTPVTIGAEEWTARGNEPAWQIEVGDEAMTLTGIDIPTLTVPRQSHPIAARGIEVYSGSTNGRALTLVATEAICNDTMTGMPFPKAVVAVLDAQPLVGCGGDPRDLLFGEWTVLAIEGRPVIAGPNPSLGFDSDGSLYGDASCNRLFGTFAVTGEGLVASPAGTTRMACEDLWMDQEQRLLDALAAVAGFDRPSDGVIRLLSASGSELVLLGSD